MGSVSGNSRRMITLLIVTPTKVSEKGLLVFWRARVGRRISKRREEYREEVIEGPEAMVLPADWLAEVSWLLR